MILIVDDKPENIYSLKKILELNNFAVDTALSGEEALKKVLKASYALIILDVQMPGMDGFEVAEAISGISKAKDIPIIFLSAINTDKRFVTKGYASGGMDYITKPVDPDILLLKVKTFYKLYEQTQELTQIHHTLREEIETRKNAERKKDEFISIASHELKTPLTSIKAYLQLSERSIADGNVDTTKQYLQRTQRQLDKLNDLIADLLDISKIESGKLKFNKKNFEFDPLLQSAADIIRQTHEGSRILISGKASVDIFGDEVRIEQVLINYLTNAFKYSPQSKEVEIYVEKMANNQLKVNVKDFGIGIPKNKQEGIFDKFYRVEETSHRFQGMGIGLYICAEILRRHNGAFGVDSEEGKGSTFWFTLPIAGNL